MRHGGRLEARSASQSRQQSTKLLADVLLANLNTATADDNVGQIDHGDCVC